MSCMISTPLGWGHKRCHQFSFSVPAYPMVIEIHPGHVHAKCYQSMFLFAPSCRKGA